MRHVRATRLAALILGVAIGGATSVNGRGQGVGGSVAASAAQRCAALKGADGWPNTTTVLASAVLNPGAPAAPAAGPFTPPTPPLPEHCELVGRLNERDGANGQRYAIAFRLRLPTSWNDRFFFQGGGGSNGMVGNALGALQGQQPTVALALGYAVVSQDSGHDNMLNNDPMRGGTQTFGFDPQARLDFGYNSYDEVTLDTIEWWTEVNTANLGRAADFVRLFAVPGMNHCAGGPSTDQFDAFGALVNWVEKGVAPERIVATAGMSTPWPGRTRPLCAYPKHAHYTGAGDPEDAKGFDCRN